MTNLIPTGPEGFSKQASQDRIFANPHNFKQKLLPETLRVLNGVQRVSKGAAQCAEHPE
jgi:hypothetical protein